MWWRLSGRIVLVPTLLLLVLASAGCGSGKSAPSTTTKPTSTIAFVFQTGALPASRFTPPPSGLTANGRLVWEFEGLLEDVFGSRHPYSTGTGSLNFACAGASNCVPHSKWNAYVYTFAVAHGSTLLLSSRTFAPGAFGNYPIPIRVNGHYVACDKAQSTFLVNLGGTTGFALLCLKPSS